MADRRRSRPWLPTLWLLALAFGAIGISLGHLAMDGAARQTMIAAFAGQAYADAQLPAFAEKPVLVGVHAVTGVVFAALAPLQFWARLRNQNRPLHRRIGYVLITTMTVLALSGVAVSIVYPFAGLAGVVPNLFWLGVLAICVGNALRRIRRRDMVGHQAWMTRAVAATLGITLSRIYLPVLTAGLGLSSQVALATVFWIGAGSSLLIAELWLRRRGLVRRSVPRAAAAPGPQADSSGARQGETP